MCEAQKILSSDRKRKSSDYCFCSYSTPNNVDNSKQFKSACSCKILKYKKCIQDEVYFVTVELNLIFSKFRIENIKIHVDV